MNSRTTWTLLGREARGIVQNLNSNHSKKAPQPACGPVKGQSWEKTPNEGHLCRNYPVADKAGKRGHYAASQRERATGAVVSCPAAPSLPLAGNRQNPPADK